MSRVRTLPWAAGDARRAARLLRWTNNVSITDVTTALGTALRGGADKEATTAFDARDSVLKDTIVAMSFHDWRYAIIPGPTHPDGTVSWSIFTHAYDGSQLLALYSSQEKMEVVLDGMSDAEKLKAMKVGTFNEIMFDLLPNMSVEACKERGASEDIAVRAFSVDPHDGSDEVAYPILSDVFFPLIRDVLFKTVHESGLAALRRLIEEKGVAAISSTSWTALCTGALVGLPTGVVTLPKEQVHHNGGLCAIKVGPTEQLLCLGGDDGGGMQLVLCAHAADAQRMIDVGLGDQPAVKDSAEVWALSPEQTKQAIQGYVDGVGEPKSTGVRIMTHVTLATDDDADGDTAEEDIGFHRLNSQALMLTPAMYADPASSMKAGLDAVVDDDGAWRQPW